MPNSEVKPISADDSVGPPHVKVGHRQAPLQKPLEPMLKGFLLLGCRAYSAVRNRAGLHAARLVCDDGQTKTPAIYRG
jgi:hypothetical protein